MESVSARVSPGTKWEESRLKKKLEQHENLNTNYQGTI